MYIEVYLFYASFVGIIILLSYKARVIRQYDKVNQNHLYFDSFPRIRLWFLEKVHVFAVFAEEKIFRFLWSKIIKNTILIRKGVILFIADMRYGRRKLGDMIEKSGAASGYMQTIIDQKKKIRRSAQRHL